MSNNWINYSGNQHYQYDNASSNYNWATAQPIYDQPRGLPPLRPGNDPTIIGTDYLPNEDTRAHPYMQNIYRWGVNTGGNTIRQEVNKSGGWETWARDEIYRHLRSVGLHADTEFRLYANAPTTAVDLCIQPRATGAQDGPELVGLELKCQKSTETGATFRHRIQKDLEKIRTAVPTSLPCHLYSVILTIDEEGTQAMQQLPQFVQEPAVDYLTERHEAEYPFRLWHFRSGFS